MNIQSSMLLVSISMMSLAGCASKIERQFISGCKTGGIEGDVCECIYDKLEKKYGEDDLKNNIWYFRAFQSNHLRLYFFNFRSDYCVKKYTHLIVWNIINANKVQF